MARRGDGGFLSSATIQNGSLSQANTLDQPTCFCFNYGPIPSWTSTGSQTGSWQPSTTSYYSPLPGIVAYSNGGTLSQTLTTGLQANTTYTLLVDVGHRLEAGLVAGYSLTLQAGSTVLATITASNGTIPAGSFQTQALTYTAGSAPPAGNLIIVLQSYGPQVNFKNVRLNLSSVGQVHYYFSDHLGSSNVVTSASGVIEEESDYYPFGGERVILDTLPDQNYKFTGKERDPETNLDYFGARYYAFNFGRFITPDWADKPTAVPYANFGNPQSLNLYTYVWNNPLARIDIDGHCGDEQNACSNVDIAVTLKSEPQMVRNLKLGPGHYFSGVAGTLSIRFTDDKGNPIKGMSVKESNTTSSGKLEENPNPVKTSSKGTISDVVGKGLITSGPSITSAEIKQGKEALTTNPVKDTSSQTLTFTTKDANGQSCTCEASYSRTLTNTDSNGNLNTTTNSHGVNYTLTTTEPIVTPVETNPKP